MLSNIKRTHTPDKSDFNRIWYISDAPETDSVYGIRESPESVRPISGITVHCVPGFCTDLAKRSASITTTPLFSSYSYPPIFIALSGEASTRITFGIMFPPFGSSQAV